MALTKTVTHGTITTAGTTTTTVTHTVAVGDLVIVGIQFENGGGNSIDAATPITKTGTATTWTKIVDDNSGANANDCRTVFYAGYVTDAGSFTFTHTKTNVNSVYRRMSVWAITGTTGTLATDIPSGKRFNLSSFAANQSQSITPAGAGSLIFGGLADWSQTNSFSALTNNTLTNTADQAGAYTAVWVEPTTNPLSSGSAFTWGANSTGGHVTGGVFEVVDSGPIDDNVNVTGVVGTTAAGTVTAVGGTLITATGVSATASAGTVVEVSSGGWRYVGVGTANTVITTGHTLPLPAGTQQGDLLIACISSRIASTTAVTLPGGGEWTLANNSLINNVLTTANGTASGTMAYCVRGASNPNTIFTHPVAPSVAIGSIVAYRPYGGTATLDVTVSARTANNITSVSTTGLTTATASELIVKMVAGGQEAAWSAHDAATDPTTSSATGTDQTGDPIPGTWQERQDTNTTTGADTSLAIADAIRATAGATGALTATASIAASHTQIAAAFRISPSYPIMGIAVAAAAGNVTVTTSSAPTTNVSITGVSSTASAGSPTVTRTANVAITGVVGTTSAGTLTTRTDDSAAVTGVSATASAGTVTISSGTNANAAVTGVSATATASYLATDGTTEGGGGSLTRTQRYSTYGVNNPQNIFNHTTSSFTPSSNSLLVVELTSITGFLAPAPVYTVSGGSLTWTPRVNATASDAGQGFQTGVYIWTAPVTTGSSITVTVSLTSGGSDGASIVISDFTGYNQSTPTGLSGSNTASQTTGHAGTENVSLGGTTASDSYVIGALIADGVDGQGPIDGGSGWTENLKANNTPGWLRYTHIGKTGALSTADWSAWSADYGHTAAGLEIKAAGGGGSSANSGIYGVAATTYAGTVTVTNALDASPSVTGVVATTSAGTLAPYQLTPPVYRSSNGSTYGVRTTTTINKPAGTVENDIMILSFFGGGSPTADVGSITPPTGWTLIGNTFVEDAGGFDGNFWLYWKRANTAEPTSWDFTHSSIATQGVIFSYSNCVTSGSPIDTYGVTTNNFIQSFVAAGITTITPEVRYLYVGHDWDAAARTAPTSMTERWDSGLIYMADQLQVVPGATGTKSQSVNPSGGNPTAAFLLALKPAYVSALVPNWTWNSSDKSADLTLSNGNLTATGTTNNDSNVRGTVGKTSGKWYYEILFGTVATNFTGLGLINSSAGLDTWMGDGTQNDGFATYRQISAWDKGGLPVGSAPGWTTGDRIGVAWDADNELFWITKNGSTWYGDTSAGSPAAGTGGLDYSSIDPGPYYPAIALGNGDSATVYPNSSQWTWSAPSGFIALTSGGSSDASPTATGVSATASAGTVTVTRTANVAVTGVSATASAGTPTVTGTANVAVTGVSATTAAGTVSVTGTANVSVTGVSATAAAGTVTVTGTANVSVTGVSATASAGTVTTTTGTNYTVTGVAATATAGTPTVRVDDSVTITGVSATTSAGTVTVTGTANVAVTGVSATASAGTVTTRTDDSITLTGVAATASAGTPTVTGTANVTVTGVSATASAGTVTTATGTQVTVTGVQATASAGTPTVTGTANVSITGVSATASAGTATTRTDDSATVTGVQATAAAGTPTFTSTANVSVTGVSATASAGTVSFTGGANYTVTGVQATAAAGTVTVTGTANASVTGVSATASAGTVSFRLDKNQTLTGVGVTASAGTVTTTTGTNYTLTGVGATASAGTVSTTGTANVSVTGVQVTTSAGTVSVTGTANASVTGVSATAQAGTVTSTSGTVVSPVGVQATATAGTVSVTGTAVVGITGVSATATAGDAIGSSPGSASITGVEATAYASFINFVFPAQIELQGAQAIAAAGELLAQLSSSFRVQPQSVTLKYTAGQQAREVHYNSGHMANSTMQVDGALGAAVETTLKQGTTTRTTLKQGRTIANSSFTVKFR